MWNDFRYALRQARRAPGFTAAAILILALGVGANAAVFSVMRAVLYRSMPVSEPARLFIPRSSATPGGQTGYGASSLTWSVFEALRAQTQAFAAVAGFVPLGIGGNVDIRVGGEPAVASADMASDNYFSALGVRFALGRGFAPGDETRHAAVAVLGYGYWNRRFARNPAVLGQTVFIKGAPFSIVGVADPGFYGFEPTGPTDLWIPFQERPELPPWGQPGQSLRGDPQWWFLLTVARLQSGVTPAQAVAAVQPAFFRAAYVTQAPPAKNPARLSLAPARGLNALQDEDGFAVPLRILMAMVGLVLGIVCINLALLLRARNQTRSREFKLRLALGAGTWRMARPLLVETGLLVAAGALLGTGFAYWASGALGRWEELDIGLRPDAATLLFTLAVAAVVVLLIGIAPIAAALRSRALNFRNVAPAAALGRRQARIGRALVAVQVALALALVANAALLMRSLRNIERVDYGIDSRDLLVFGLTAPRDAATNAQRLAFFHLVVDRLAAAPGVVGVTLKGNRLGSGWSNNASALIDGNPPLGARNAPLRWDQVGSGYFAVMGQPLLSGRDFTAADLIPTPDAAKPPPTVAVVNRTFVEKYLHGGAALGHILQRGTGGTAATIIGVAQDAKYSGAEEQPRPMAWFPYTGGASTMQLQVRTAADPMALVPLLRSTLQPIAPVPLEKPMAQERQWRESYSNETLLGRLGLFFAILAGVLVATGLYGTLAYQVGRRTAEIGVRMALGARRTAVLWMILRESLAVIALGLVAGIPLAWLGARALAGVLFHLSPNDVTSLVAAAVALTAVALAAAWFPACRAAAVDPNTALRCE